MLYHPGLPGRTRFIPLSEAASSVPSARSSLEFFCPASPHQCPQVLLCMSRAEPIILYLYNTLPVSDGFPAQKLQGHPSLVPHTFPGQILLITPHKSLLQQPLFFTPLRCFSAFFLPIYFFLCLLSSAVRTYHFSATRNCSPQKHLGPLSLCRLHPPIVPQPHRAFL